MINIEEISLVKNVNNEFNLNAKEAFKLMLDGKEVIDEQEYIYSLFFSNIIYLKYENNIIMHRGETDANTFLKSNKRNKVFKFKEYIEPKKTNKIITFNSYIGENTVYKPFKKCPIENAFGHEVSRLCDDIDALKSVYEKVSKVKVTFEIIE